MYHCQPSLRRDVVALTASAFLRVINTITTLGLFGRHSGWTMSANVLTCVAVRTPADIADRRAGVIILSGSCVYAPLCAGVINAGASQRRKRARPCCEIEVRSFR